MKKLDRNSSGAEGVHSPSATLHGEMPRGGGGHCGTATSPSPSRASDSTLGMRTLLESKRMRVWRSALPFIVELKNNLSEYFPEGARYHYSHTSSPSREYNQMCTVLQGILEASARDQPPLLARHK